MTTTIENTASDENILGLIRNQPGIAAEEIASALGCELEDVHATLLPHISKGKVKVERIDGTAGKKNTYTINSAFLGWSPPAGSKPAAASETSEGSKVDRAVAFLRAKGRATSEALSAAMGLPAGTPPHSYMKAALKHNRVARDGQDWILGTEQEQGAPAAPPPVAASRTPKKTKPARPAHIPQDAIQSSLAIGTLRIIQWANGNLVVSANDNTVDLDPEQARALRAFISLS